jgi:hypothetical protein
MHSKRSRYEGLLYLMPALVFVLIFTVIRFCKCSGWRSTIGPFSAKRSSSAWGIS